MIQPTELRIGNYLNYYNQNCHVMGIYNYGKIELGYFEESIGFIRQLDDKGIHPIPLTEEILLKCGFEKDEVVKCLHHLKIGNIIISIVIEGSDVLDVTFANTNITGVSIDTESCLYLHGLQNITHALTNTELNITL